MSEKIVITLQPERSNSIYRLTYDDIDYDIDIDDYVSIHYDNIVGELLVNSTLFLHAGRLLAEANDIERTKESQYKLERARAEERLRKSLYSDYKEGRREKAPIKEEMQNKALLDEGVGKFRSSYFRSIKTKEDIQAFYDAIKSKDFKLNKLIEKISPEQYDSNFIAGTLHDILMRKFKPAIG